MHVYNYSEMKSVIAQEFRPVIARKYIIPARFCLLKNRPAKIAGVPVVCGDGSEGTVRNSSEKCNGEAIVPLISMLSFISCRLKA